MYLELKSTKEITMVNGAPCRVWTGSTGQGVPVLAYISALRVETQDDQSEFEAELKEVHPNADVRDVIPLRFVV